MHSEHHHKQISDFKIQSGP